MRLFSFSFFMCCTWVLGMTRWHWKRNNKTRAEIASFSWFSVMSAFFFYSGVTMKAYGKLIKLIFHVPCWQRRCLYLLHSSFWSRLPLPTCVLVLCRAKSLSFLLGKRRTNKKHLLGSSQPVVLPSAFSLLLADFFFPPSPPTSWFLP